jgi:hypothetical protein
MLHAYSYTIFFVFCLHFVALMRHGVDVISPSSWEPQEEGMMSTIANFPSVRNQGLSNPGKSQTPEGDAC